MKKGYPTDTNLWVVSEKIKEHGFVPGRVASVDHPHIKRVIVWGGLEPREGGGFQLTSKGAELMKKSGY
tara:strand:- start:169 stop:375 length:207 start_codon:yes stop_codon:yes gene_type:complete